MKKLLILMLVLGLASAANAALVLSLDGDTDIDEITISVSQTVVVDLYNTDGGDYGAYLDFYYLSDDKFDLNDPCLTDLAGDLSSYDGPYDAGIYDLDAWEVAVTLAQSVGTTTPGAQFTIDLHCRGAGDVYIELLDPDLNVIDTATIAQIPEPMTIALLGLGGLLLRRRK